MVNQSWRILDLLSRWFVSLYSLVQYIPHSITIWVMSFTLFRSNFLYIKVSNVTNFPLYFLNSVLKHHEFNMYSPEIKHGTWTSPIAKKETHLPNPSFLASNIFIFEEVLVSITHPATRGFWSFSATGFPITRGGVAEVVEQCYTSMSCAEISAPKKNFQGLKWPPFFFKGRATTKYPKSAVLFLFSENVLIGFFKTKSSVF